MSRQHKEHSFEEESGHVDHKTDHLIILCSKTLPFSPRNIFVASADPQQLKDGLFPVL